jgi:hypothetical protein
MDLTTEDMRDTEGTRGSESLDADNGALLVRFDRGVAADHRCPPYSWQAGMPQFAAGSAMGRVNGWASSRN